MALRKRTLDIPLGGGVNTKTTSKQLKAPEFLDLRNVRFQKDGKIEKKFGYTNLGQNINTGTLNTPVALGTIRDELLMLSTDKIYTRSESDSKWYDKGDITATSTEITKISSAPIDGSAVDVMIQDNIKVATWLEGTTIYYSIFDLNTGSSIVEKATLVTSAGSIFPRITSLPGSIYIFWNTSTNLVFKRIPTSAPLSSSDTTLDTGMDSTGQFDVDSDGTNLYVMFKLTGVSTIRISKLNSDGVVVTTNTIASQDPTAALTTAINAFFSTDANKTIISLGWVDSSDNVIGVAYDPNLVQLFSPVTVEATVSDLDKLIIAIDDTTQSSVRFIYNITASDTKDYVTRSNTLTNAGTKGTASVLMRAVGIASRACYFNDVSYFNVLHESTLQSTYFSLTAGGRVVSKFAAGEAGAHSITKRPSNFTALNTNTFTWGALKKGRILSENATLFSYRSPHFADLIFDPAKAFISTPIQQNFVISGGIVLAYDGESTTEYGFHMGPEDVSLAQSGSGGSVPNGTYLVSAIYEWADKQGIRYQSVPSVPQSITVTGGSSSKITATIPSLRITDKSGDTTFPTRVPVKIRLFITEDAGSIPYFTAQVDNPDILTTDSVDLDLTTAPADITSNEILYTSGGVIENTAPPSCGYIFTHKNRPICVKLEERNQIAFGKQIRPENGVGFNADFVIDLDPEGGDAIAGASMDDYAIIFKETAIMAISGGGPNDLGANNTFSDPQLISSDIGCQDPKSVLQMPEGIIFKSRKGIYLLTRGLELVYIGSNVEDFNSSTILSTNILKNTNEIRFVTDANVTLVYNYYFKKWSIFDTPGILDAVVWRNADYVYLTPTKVLNEDSTTYLDDGSYVQSKIRTGWINLAGLQGFQRIYEMAMIGTFFSDHVFQINHYYDYSERVQDTISITASSLVNTELYGSNAVYGGDDFYGGSANDEVFQLREGLPRQLCQSISFEFVDSISGSNNGQGFSIEGLSLTVGVKSGLNRTNISRSV